MSMSVPEAPLKGPLTLMLTGVARNSLKTPLLSNLFTPRFKRGVWPETPTRAHQLLLGSARSAETNDGGQCRSSVRNNGRRWEAKGRQWKVKERQWKGSVEGQWKAQERQREEISGKAVRGQRKGGARSAESEQKGGHLDSLEALRDVRGPQTVGHHHELAAAPRATCVFREERKGRCFWSENGSLPLLEVLPLHRANDACGRAGRAWHAT